MSHIRLVQFLARAASLAPDQAAMRFNDRVLSWAEFNDLTERLAGGLRSIGVGAGDRLAILALNSERYAALMFAAWRLRAAIVPLNTRWSHAEIADALTDCDPALLAIDNDFLEMAVGLRDEARRPILNLEDGEFGSDGHRYSTLLGLGVPVTDLGGGDSEMAGIFYTGGTTGRPKGAMLSHVGLTSTLFGAQGAAVSAEDASLLCVLPMFHLAGAQLAVAAAIATRPLIIHPGFDVAAVLDCIAADRVETLSLVPAMWAMLVDHPAAAGADLSSLRRALYGASPMPEGILRRVAARLPGVELAQGYGQTEASGVITLLGPEDHDPDAPTAHRLRSAGRPIPFIELRILDANGQPVPRGTVGEVVVRGTGTMIGYWNRPEETATTLRDGWLMTGDAGYLDEDGYVFLVDRTKDMIVSGGENIYSTETESALSSHPDVLACAVIGIPDAKWGESVHAIVVLRPGAAPDGDALIAHCRDRIAGYKCPKSVSFRTEPLPLSAAGKVLKRDLRAPYWEGRERAIN